MTIRKYPSINDGLVASISKRIKLLRSGESIAGGEDAAALLEGDLELLLSARAEISKLLFRQRKITNDIRSHHIAEQNYDFLTGNYGDILASLNEAIAKARENIYNLRGYYKNSSEPVTKECKDS